MGAPTAEHGCLHWPSLSVCQDQLPYQEATLAPPHTHVSASSAVLEGGLLTNFASFLKGFKTRIQKMSSLIRAVEVGLREQEAQGGPAGPCP